MKRLLLSIPSVPNGFYSTELAWWLTAIQVQSTLLEFGAAMAESTENLAERLMLRKAAEKFSQGWIMEQATLQWQDPRKDPNIGKPFVPEGWSIAVAPIFGAPIAAVRNEQARRFLYHSTYEKDAKLEPPDFDAVLLIDTDNVPGRHDLHVLCEDISREDVDVVGGVYCMEAPEGPKPLVYRVTDDYKGFEYDGKVLTEPVGLHKLEGGGLPGGMLMVKRRVFERMWEARRVWFKDRLHDASVEYYELHKVLMENRNDKAKGYDALWNLLNERGDDWTLNAIGSWHIGEDIWFCRMCREMGIDVWVDTRVVAKHIKHADNKQTFLRQQAIGRRFFKMGVESESKTALSEDEKDERYHEFVRGKHRGKIKPIRRRSQG